LFLREMQEKKGLTNNWLNLIDALRSNKDENTEKNTEENMLPGWPLARKKLKAKKQQSLDKLNIFKYIETTSKSNLIVHNQNTNEIPSNEEQSEPTPLVGIKKLEKLNEGLEISGSKNRLKVLAQVAKAVNRLRKFGKSPEVKDSKSNKQLNEKDALTPPKENENGSNYVHSIPFAGKQKQELPFKAFKFDAKSKAHTWQPYAPVTDYGPKVVGPKVVGQSNYIQPGTSTKAANSILSTNSILEKQNRVNEEMYQNRQNSTWENSKAISLNKNTPTNYLKPEVGVKVTKSVLQKQRYINDHIIVNQPSVVGENVKPSSVAGRTPENSGRTLENSTNLVVQNIKPTKSMQDRRNLVKMEIENLANNVGANGKPSLVSGRPQANSLQPTQTNAKATKSFLEKQSRVNDQIIVNQPSRLGENVKPSSVVDHPPDNSMKLEVQNIKPTKSMQGRKNLLNNEIENNLFKNDGQTMKPSIISGRPQANSLQPVQTNTKATKSFVEKQSRVNDQIIVNQPSRLGENVKPSSVVDRPPDNSMKLEVQNIKPTKSMQGRKNLLNNEIQNNLLKNDGQTMKPSVISGRPQANSLQPVQTKATKSFLEKQSRVNDQIIVNQPSGLGENVKPSSVVDRPPDNSMKLEVQNINPTKSMQGRKNLLNNEIQNNLLKNDGQTMKPSVISGRPQANSLQPVQTISEKQGRVKEKPVSVVSRPKDNSVQLQIPTVKTTKSFEERRNRLNTEITNFPNTFEANVKPKLFDNRPQDKLLGSDIETIKPTKSYLEKQKRINDQINPNLVNNLRTVTPRPPTNVQPSTTPVVNANQILRNKQSTSADSHTKANSSAPLQNQTMDILKNNKVFNRAQQSKKVKGQKDDTVVFVGDTFNKTSKNSKEDSKEAEVHRSFSSRIRLFQMFKH